MHQQTAALVAWPRGDGAEVSMAGAFRDAIGELLGRRSSRAELDGERRGCASGSLLIEPARLAALCLRPPVRTKMNVRQRHRPSEL